MNEAFVDESVRGDIYIICATQVSQRDLVETRKKVRSLPRPGRRRIHFNKEGDRYRRSLLTSFAKMGVSSVIYVVRHADLQAARTAILQKVVSEMKEDRVVRLVLESRANQDTKDREDILYALRISPIPSFTYDHLPASNEPLLWIPDAVAWSWGKGGEWRRQVEKSGLVGRVVKVEVH